MQLEDLQNAIEFLSAIKDANLDDPNMPIHPETLKRLRNPPQHPCVLEDAHKCFTLDLFLATTNASEQTYNDVCKAYACLHPEHADKILSHYRMKHRMVELTGVDLLVHDMCINSCIAYTGPLACLEKCPKCDTS
ncbi:hypothetical protein SERLA73DRAFT_123651 [Serpula lacrymans var. lacrymans S7.3]|uniref:Uncharacterized protein n=2 Tax=Serpula lacrymans var. lacrymans TaxID=341189 RepID=F8PZJ9_SERL3|nr:uncharacterized protein SERLADRAFT_370724 [Serpula lacrymans var. lacrymans S7.9]EGN98321.1 hypothetical protein SERLA73DRAFT_123651 [Serpula lacrymans var. lacrymans S7.3]EGO23887.1 hypothetical protein SERLADRAFT_370724 [Serpula lacrymans var. lacrymans S7.9]